MNLSLQDPFAVAKEYPETLTTTLQYGHSVVIQYNFKGDYLASGITDGSVIIYDLTTGGVVAHLHRGGHSRPVTSLSWSWCGRYLLLLSQDWTCNLWDLSLVNRDENNSSDTSSAVIRRVQFDGPIWLALLHPQKPFCFAATLFDDRPVYVDASDGDNIVVNRLATAPEHKDKHMTLVMAFTPDGSHLFAGTSKGYLNVFDTKSLEIVHQTKVANLNIKTLTIAPNGRKLAVNSSDRVIRQINLPDMLNESPETWEFDVEQKYQDVVNRLQWNAVLFNHNAEFMVASTFGQSLQDLYVWETLLGLLIKILEGSSEELIDVKWNYNRCMIGSTGLDSGTVYLWLVQFPQKWSALAPDFVEIEENIEYEEKEDEFDIIDEDILIKKRLEEEDQVIDIVTCETVDARGFDINQPSFVIPVNYERAPLDGETS